MPMSLDAVNAYASSLPDVAVGATYGRRAWTVAGRAFAWQRPLGKADLKRFGDAVPPAGDIIAVTVADLAAKEALLAKELPGFFTIAHFDGYAALLVALRAARAADVREAIAAAWHVQFTRGPKRPRPASRTKGVRVRQA